MWQVPPVGHWWKLPYVTGGNEGRACSTKAKSGAHATEGDIRVREKTERRFGHGGFLE